MKNIFTKENLNKTLRVKKDVLDRTQNRYSIDASGLTLGKLAVVLSNYLMWKNKAHYCDFRDCGDFVLVQNAEKIKVTGNKLTQKMYHTYSGRKGNVKSMTLSTMLNKKPEKVLRFAVRWMLPKNKLRDHRMKRLKLIIGTTNKYDYLHPQAISV
jgi:large subunit ribosomal protein L13